MIQRWISTQVVSAGAAGRLMALAMVVAYLPALGAFFVKDDLALLSSAVFEVPAAFGHSWPGGFFRPVAELFFGGQYALFGLHPLPYHLVSLAAHGLAVFLVYRVFSQLTEHPQKSLAVAGVFALHPLNTESVSWIAGQMGLFSGVYVLLVLHLLLSHRSPRPWWRIPLVLGVFAIGLGCYENQIVAPLLWGWVWVVCSRLRSHRQVDDLALALLFAGAIAVYLYWRSAVLGLGGGYYEMGLSLRIGMANLVYYLYLLGGGSAIGARILNYHPEQIWSGGFFEVFTPLFILNLLLLLGTGICLRSGLSQAGGKQEERIPTLRYLLLAGGWILIALAPALVLDQRPRRLAYLAVPGYALIAVEAFFWLKQKTCPGPLGVRAGLIGGVLLLLATLHLRNQDWWEAGKLEEGLPAVVQQVSCSHLAFDVPDLLGDALFFNSGAVEFWLERQTGKQGWRVYAPHQFAAVESLPPHTCCFRYQEHQIRPLVPATGEQFPSYVRGQNWAVSGH